MEQFVLKAANVKLSSLVWKIRLFYGTILVLESPITKPFSQLTLFFIVTGLPEKNPNQHWATKLGPTTTNLSVPDLENYQQSRSLLTSKQRNNTAQQCENTSNFKTMNCMVIH